MAFAQYGMMIVLVLSLQFCMGQEDAYYDGSNEIASSSNTTNSTTMLPTSGPCPCPGGESWCPQPPDGVCPCEPGHTTGPNGEICHTPKGKKGKGLLSDPAAMSATVLGTAMSAGVIVGVGWMFYKRRQKRHNQHNTIPVYHVVGVDERASLLNSGADAPPMYSGKDSFNMMAIPPPAYASDSKK